MCGTLIIRKKSTKKFLLFDWSLLASVHGARSVGYGLALAIFSACAFVAVILFAAIGREAKGIEFTKADEEEFSSEGGLREAVD